MFNKYAELRKIALLYTACKGLLRMKAAEMAMPNWNTFIGNIGNFDPSKTDAATLFNSLSKGQADEFMGRLSEGNSTQRGYAQQLQSAYDKAYNAPQPQDGNAPPQQQQNGNVPPQNGNAPPQNGNAPPQQQNGNAPPQNTNQQVNQQQNTNQQVNQQQQQRRPTSPLQQHQMSRQKYMQNHQKQIQQAGQQAQQNATKGFFGRAMNWLTGGGYGGWAAGRAQAKQQRQLNQRYDQQGAQLKANQQKARQRMQAAQFQKFMMSRQPQQPASPVQTPKAAGYSLLSLFPGYRQLFNYV